MNKTRKNRRKSKKNIRKNVSRKGGSNSNDNNSNDNSYNANYNSNNYNNNNSNYNNDNIHQIQDRTELLELLRISGLELQYASDDLKNDPAILLISVKNNGLALQLSLIHI